MVEGGRVGLRKDPTLRVCLNAGGGEAVRGALQTVGPFKLSGVWVRIARHCYDTVQRENKSLNGADIALCLKR